MKLNQVIIADDRTAWQKQEDKWSVCFFKCKLYKHCASHHGIDCKKMGGEKIPKLRGRY